VPLLLLQDSVALCLQPRGRKGAGPTRRRRRRHHNYNHGGPFKPLRLCLYRRLVGLRVQEKQQAHLARHFRPAASWRRGRWRPLLRGNTRQRTQVEYLEQPRRPDLSYRE